MISHCPHCQVDLSLNEEQLARLEQTVSALAPGKTLNIKCPKCLKAIKLDRSGNPSGKKISKVKPPAPPNLDWLKAGIFQAEEKVEDVPMALVLHGDKKQRALICKAMETVGYQTVSVSSPDEARNRMQFVNFACVVLHSGLEGGLAKSTFHQYMREMPMFRRRYIFYILLGPDFHTLYSLEALANSANLVVNDDDLNHLELVLRKAIPEYEELFGPILDELASYGKR